MNFQRLIVITGLSGSGKSTAARVLEDEGFYVVDNLPPALLPKFLQLTVWEEKNAPGLAVVMDVRSRKFVAAEWPKIVELVRADGYEVEIWFFDAADEDLIRRFSETRRRHPLVHHAGLPAAVRHERELLADIRSIATAVFDSTGLSIHQLRQAIARYLHGGEDPGQALAVSLQSFGYRFGLPLEADLVMDVRFLPNPHYDESLRPFSGLDPNVRTFVLSQQSCREFLSHFKKLLGFLLPLYQREGKRYLTIAVGCTGGRHRSVAVVEDLRALFAEPGYNLTVLHRDMNKEKT